MKIVIITDAWEPQVNGVVNTLKATRLELERSGHVVAVISPEGFRTLPCPTYPDIRLSLFPLRRVTRLLDELQPELIHISTEGPLGLAARRYCLRRSLPFTTAYHTRFPEYIHARCRLPLAISYAWMRWFHRPSRAVMVPTPIVKREIAARGIRHAVDWTRGVNTDVFHPMAPDRELTGTDALPIFLYVGRVAVEKNIEAFLKLELPGIKWVVGDGPQRRELEAKYRDAKFFGMKLPPDLARYYQSADVFVFPSKTDTFGLVLLESIACGTPVAAYPVPGPADVIDAGITGVLNTDLRMACIGALRLPRVAVAQAAERLSWARATEQFQLNISRYARQDGAAAVVVAGHSSGSD
jgi:glycosyltransferase involved in cell wall biosynthesis